TGKIIYESRATTGGNSYMSEDFSNSDVEILAYTGGVGNTILRAGTLKCKNFTVTTTLNNVQMLNTTYNPSFIFSGDVDLEAGVNSTTYSAGGGTILLTGVAKNIRLAGLTVEKITINTGATYTFLEGFESGNFTANGEGTFDPTKSYDVDNPTGASTLHSTTPVTAYIYYDGLNTFSGTLDNVVLVENESGQTRHDIVIQKPNKV
ncbi:unnamed protein product, partial [marine sediment metagenome]